MIKIGEKIKCERFLGHSVWSHRMDDIRVIYDINLDTSQSGAESYAVMNPQPVAKTHQFVNIFWW